MTLRRSITKVLIRSANRTTASILATESAAGPARNGLYLLVRSTGSHRSWSTNILNKFGCSLFCSRMSSTAASSSNPLYTANKNDIIEFPSGMNQSTRELANDLLLRPDDNSNNNNNSYNPSIDHSDEEQLFWRRRVALSKTITLVESSNPEQHKQAALLLSYLLQQPSQQPDAFFRVGLAGPPGAGKSTLIEALGRYVLDLGIPTTDDNNNNNDDIWRPGKLSVICIDPSSVTTGGSIMGDKTRMMELSRDHRAFVRPAPTKGAWGGLAPKTDDVIRIVAASESYPLILLETVGLGQSELEVQQCVDMLILAVPPGGGDSLQGVKKGIVEIADTIIVTKADGDLLVTARHTAADYRGAMQFLNIVTTDDDHTSDHRTATPILLVSSVTGDGISKLWQQISDFRTRLINNGILNTKRQQQNRYWMWKNLRALVLQQLNDDPIIQQLANHVIADLDAGRIPPRVAATLLLENLNKN